jgi:hypothetical protein
MSGGCRTWPACFKCQRTSFATGRCVAGFAPGRFRRAVSGLSGPMGGNDSGYGGSAQPRNEAIPWKQDHLLGSLFIVDS